jgi:hypothetical protein
MKTLCIDLRWIDSSGVGVSINGVMQRIVKRLCDVSIERRDRKSGSPDPTSMVRPWSVKVRMPSMP